MQPPGEVAVQGEVVATSTSGDHRCGEHHRFEKTTWDKAMVNNGICMRIN